MPRLKITCPRNQNHVQFRVNVEVMESWKCDEHGKCIKSEGVLGPIREPGVGDEWHCVECEEPAIATVDTPHTPIDQLVQDIEADWAEEGEGGGEDDDEAEEESPKIVAAKRPRTLKQARNDYFEVVDAGGEVICECCDRPGQRQKEYVGRAGAIGLICLIAKNHVTPRPIKLPWFAPWRNGIATMRFHELIEGDSIDQPDDLNGFWTPTEKGHAFAEGRLTIPSRIVKYNKKPIGYGGKEKSIEDLLGKHNYERAKDCMEDHHKLFDWLGELGYSIPRRLEWDNVSNWTEE